jgi:Cdc6-like AAA superfamily ATPase
MSWFDNIGRGRSRRQAKVTPGLFDAAPEPSVTPDNPPAATPRATARPMLMDATAAFPRFHVTAHDQVDPRADGEAAELRVRFRNAFTPAQPITDKRKFAGRRGILTTLIRSLEDDRLHVILYGDRGIGKTSLLHVLAQAARDAKYQVAYISCGASSNFNEVFRNVAAEVPLLFHRDFGPTSAEAERGDTFASLLDAEPVSGRKASDLSAKVTDTRVLVILDEFDRCEDPQFRRDITEFLKNISDRSVRLQLVIAGVAENLAELLENRTIVNRNIHAIEAPRMTSEELSDLVAVGEAAGGLPFTPEARRIIVASANGLPYAASLVSHRAGLAALERNRKAVTDRDVLTALDEIIGDVHGRLTSLAQAQLRSLPPTEAEELLEPLAAYAHVSGGTFVDDDIVRAHKTPAAAEKCAQMIRRLVAEKSLLATSTDDLGVHYRFVDENVPVYLWFCKVRRSFETNEAMEPATA